ncbi:VOC family protein [Inquilinus sp. CA228]|uniref:VOC family protein n=1 Tax=Inquilinus sp. CA228 TaxID=3455609 RepID=UPI003F8D78C7
MSEDLSHLKYPEAPAQVIPSFWVEEVETLREFYLEKLGFGHMMGIVGKDGKFDFGIVRRDGIMVMMGRPQSPGGGATRGQGGARPLDIYFYVKNVDAFHDEVRSRGVAVTEALSTQWWGDRTFAVKDPYGYSLWFCQTVGAPEPPPGVTMV